MDTEGLLKLLKEHKVDEDLIRMKRIAGRPKDLEDLKYLSRLRKLKKYK